MLPFWNISPQVAKSYFQLGEAVYAGRNWPYSYGINQYGNMYFGILDNNIPYWKAVALNGMMTNPFYTPYIPLEIPSGVGAIDTSAAQLMGNKAVVRAKFNALGTNLNNLLNNINTALTSPDLTANQKAELENKKAEVEDLIKRREEFAKKSADMEVMDALAGIEALCGEYYDLKDAVNTLMQKVSAGEDVDPSLTPEQISKRYNTETKPQIEQLLQNSEVTEEEKQKIQAKQKELEEAINAGEPQEKLNKLSNELQDLIDGVNTRIHPDDDIDEEDPIRVVNPEDLTAEQIKEKVKGDLEDELDAINDDDNLASTHTKGIINKKYKELKKAIKDGKSEEEIKKLYKDLVDRINYANAENAVNQIKDAPHLDADAKRDIENKLEEIRNAIRAGKPKDEIDALYDDLNELIADATDDVRRTSEREDVKEAKDKEAAKARYSEFAQEFNNTEIAKGKSLNKYLTPKEKKEFNDLYKKYKEAVENDAPASELNNMIDKMYNLLNNHLKAANLRQTTGHAITDKIYLNAMKKNIFGKCYPKPKRAVDDAVNSINKDNVMAVLQYWYDENGPYYNTNPDGNNHLGILDTICGTCSGQNEKIKMVNQVLKAISDYAKENGLSDKVNPYITSIKGLMNAKSNDDAFKKFNLMLTRVFGIPTSEF